MVKAALTRMLEAGSDSISSNLNNELLLHLPSHQADSRNAIEIVGFKVVSRSRGRCAALGAQKNMQARFVTVLARKTPIHFGNELVRRNDLFVHSGLQSDKVSLYDGNLFSNRAGP